MRITTELRILLFVLDLIFGAWCLRLFSTVLVWHNFTLATTQNGVRSALWSHNICDWSLCHICNVTIWRAHKILQLMGFLQLVAKIVKLWRRQGRKPLIEQWIQIFHKKTTIFLRWSNPWHLCCEAELNQDMLMLTLYLENAYGMSGLTLVCSYQITWQVKSKWHVKAGMCLKSSCSILRSGRWAWKYSLQCCEISEATPN